MRVIINIPDERYKEIQDMNWRDPLLNDQNLHAIYQGKAIPKDATNGDVIKAVFPKNVTYLVESMMGMEWWNTPYR